MFLNPNIFSSLNSNCSNFLDMRNLQEQVKKASCYQKLFWPFTVWMNCSSDLKKILNYEPSSSNFKSFSRSQEQFFLTVSQNNFGNKIPCSYMYKVIFSWSLIRNLYPGEEWVSKAFCCWNNLGSFAILQLIFILAKYQYTFSIVFLSHLFLMILIFIFST